AVLKLVPVNRLLYGSDAPFGSTTGIAAALSKFELAAADITSIRRENALRLFPRFRAWRPFAGGALIVGGGNVSTDGSSHERNRGARTQRYATMRGSHRSQ